VVTGDCTIRVGALVVIGVMGVSEAGATADDFGGELVR
jgi:hypothetical protein